MLSKSPYYNTLKERELKNIVIQELEPIRELTLKSLIKIWRTMSFIENNTHYNDSIELQEIHEKIRKTVSVNY
jgi:hypothetical protein